MSASCEQSGNLAFPDFAGAYHQALTLLQFQKQRKKCCHSVVFTFLIDSYSGIE
jgi:hypothetical protein